MDSFDLFPEIDLGARGGPGFGCAKPIGRRDTGRVRPRVVRPRRSSTAALLIELLRLVNRRSRA
jgi:hypothetical protein